MLIAAGATVGVASLVSGVGTNNPNSSASTSAEGQETGGAAATNETAATGEAQTCASVDSVRIAAAEAIVPVLENVAKQACVELVLTETTATSGAAALAAGTVDVWIPDSREYGIAAGIEIAAAAPSTAWSPIVMAADPATAASISAAGPLAWGSIVAGQGTVAGMKVEIQEHADGVAMSIADKFAAASTAATGDRFLGLSSAAVTLSKITPLAAGGESAPIPAGTVRIVEERLVTDETGTLLTPLDGLPVLEYPWIATTTVTGADRLLAALTSPEATEARTDAGLLDPNTASFPLADGTAAAMVPLTNIAGTPAIFSIAGEGNRNGNAIAVVDVSGSMGQTTPEGTTLIESVRGSMIVMVQALNPGTKVGLWEFSYQISGDAHHREIVPAGELSTTRDLLVGALSAMREDPDGGTALNSTVMSAYQQAQANWDPERVNMVLIFTDGRDEDAPGTLDLPTLLTQIQATADPNRPVALVMFGYGEADTAAMTQIVTANGEHGGVYPIADSRQIAGAFATAIGETLEFN